MNGGSPAAVIEVAKLYVYVEFVELLVYIHSIIVHLVPSALAAVAQAPTAYLVALRCDPASVQPPAPETRSFEGSYILFAKDNCGLSDCNPASGDRLT